MSTGMGPMGNQNVPSPSFVGNPQMNPQMMAGPNMVPGNPSPQIIQVQPNPPPPHPPTTTNTINQNTQSQQMAPSQNEVPRLKDLIASLRETSRNFFLISAMNLDHNTQMDNFNKNLEQTPKLEKSLEDILALCNQIELCLRTILECAIQSRDSHNYLPFVVSNDFHLDGQPMADNSIPKSYANYLNIIKKQVSSAKAIYDILSESVKQIKQTPEQQQQQQMNQQAHPQQPPPHINPSNIQQQQPPSSQMHPTGPTGQLPPPQMHQ